MTIVRTRLPANQDAVSWSRDAGQPIGDRKKVGVFVLTVVWLKMTRSGLVLGGSNKA